MTQWLGRGLPGWTLIALAVVGSGGPAAAQPASDGVQARDLALVGSHDLQGRSAY